MRPRPLSEYTLGELAIIALDQHAESIAAYCLYLASRRHEVESPQVSDYTAEYVALVNCADDISQMEFTARRAAAIARTNFMIRYEEQVSQSINILNWDVRATLQANQYRYRLEQNVKRMLEGV